MCVRCPGVALGKGGRESLHEIIFGEALCTEFHCYASLSLELSVDVLFFIIFVCVREKESRVWW